MPRSLWAVALVLLPGPCVRAGHNLHLIDSDPATGFAVYRMGKPAPPDIAELCALGVEEIAVLSGNAGRYERRRAASCPTLRVVYDREQDVDRPLDRAFLERFDAWVQAAMRRGKKIAFRCNCGCHRTGRLAAYYQMRYQGLSVAEAYAVLLEHGRHMEWPRYRRLRDQVQALHDHILNEPCSVAREFCVREAPAASGDAGWLE